LANSAAAPARVTGTIAAKAATRDQVQRRE
jgi:hypothetical protein